MSLQIWLPLNGNLNNYGSYQGTITNTGATVNSAGKIGSCYSFDGSDDSILVPFNDYVTTEWSFCCWFYKDSLGEAYDTIFGGPSGFEIESRLNSTTTQVIEAHSWGGGQIPYEFNKWYHLAVTRNSSNTKWYLDGELKFTGSAGSMPSGNYYIGAWRSASEQNFKGKLNDVRIYNHCLSYSEVKELSRALVVHYPLSEPTIEPTTNIDPLRGSTLDFGHIESYERTNYMGRDCWHVIVSVTGATSWAGSYSSLNGFSAGYVGTRSCWVNFPPGQNRSGWHGCPFAFESCDVSVRKNYDFDKMGTWQYCYSTATASSTSSNFLFYWFAIGSGSARVEFYITDIQFENKDHPTPYTPNSRDSLVVHDCSGYNRNGTATGSIQVTTGSGRGTLCTSFSGENNTAIQIPFITAIVTNEFTASMWFYKSEFSSYPWDTIFGGPSGFELETKNGSSNTPVIYAYSWGSGSFEYTLNTWHHLVMTRNSAETKFYLDGTLKLTGSAGSIPSGNYFIGAWADTTHQLYKGLVSDFRVYATALSADDVDHLYKNFGSVDKNRSLLCHELKENSENIFKSEYISKYASSLDGSYGQWGTRNSVPCMLIGPSRFWYGSDDTSNGVLKDYFIPNTQYIFDMWMDGDEVVYEGINRAGGFMVWYTDNSVDYTFVITGNQSSPMGFQHKTLITPAGKSVKGIEFYYWTGNTVYYKVGSFIAPVSQASLGTNGVFNTAQIVEVDGTASINKGGSSYVNSIIEI